MSSFQHRQSAHCETGVIASLLTHSGLPISEPMAFGLGSGLAFAYLPFIKVAGQPLFAYRMPPRFIMKTLCKRLGVKLVGRQFKNEKLGQAYLDDLLTNKQIVGLQASVYWLPYFPEEMRFHFNAHNLIVYGKTGREYEVSDPVFEGVVRCDEQALNRARFAKGALAAKGFLYYLPSCRDLAPDWSALIKASIKTTTRVMAGLPLPWFGVPGVAHIGHKISRLDPDNHKANVRFLTHIVRMQEEIGTGGAGFRFMYASFLQESAELLESTALDAASIQMTQVGDAWREFALACVNYSRTSGCSDALKALGSQLASIHQQEADLIKSLSCWVKTNI